MRRQRITARMPGRIEMMDLASFRRDPGMYPPKLASIQCPSLKIGLSVHGFRRLAQIRFRWNFNFIGQFCILLVFVRLRALAQRGPER